MKEVNTDEDSVPRVSPEPGGRKGSKPSFREFRNLRDEADWIAIDILNRYKAGIAFSDIGIFYTAPFVGAAVADSLVSDGIPFEWLKDTKSKNFRPGDDSVKLMTIHSSKGLQYQVGIIAGAGCLPYLSQDDDARLMYVAMTRATHELLITGSKRSVFTDRLKQICETQAA